MHLIFNAISSFFVGSGAAVASWAVIDFNSILLLIAHEERKRAKMRKKVGDSEKKFKRLFDCISFHFVSDFIFLVALNIVCVCVRVVVHRICYDISVRRDDDYCFHRQQTYKTFAKFFAVGWAHNNGTKLYFSITFLRECASIAIEIEMKTRLPYP